MPYYLALMIVLVLSDQILKHWITVHIALDAVSRLVPSVLSLTNLRNSGAAWSILEGQQWFFYHHFVTCCRFCWLLFMAF